MGRNAIDGCTDEGTDGGTECEWVVNRCRTAVEQTIFAKKILCEALSEM